MSVAAQLVHDAGLSPEQAEYVGIPMSWEAYEALGEDVRGEYIDGRLYVNAQQVKLADGTEVTIDPKALFAR